LDDKQKVTFFQLHSPIKIKAFCQSRALWQYLHTKTRKKLALSKQTGQGAVEFDAAENVVLDIIGRDSANVKVITVVELLYPVSICK